MIYSFDLSQKVIIVTGGYGHLGKAIVESLSFHGAEVYVLGKEESKFNLAFQKSSKLSDKISFQYCDIANSDSISESFESVYLKTQRIDVIINNAAYNRGQSPETMSDDDWEYGVQGVLNSAYKCMQHIIPYFKEAKSGKIINVSSMYGMVAPDFEIYKDFPQFLNQPNYGAAKAGVIQLTKYFASYLGKLGISVNTITPGPFPTLEIQKNAKFVKELATRTCLNRIGIPEDIAGAFVFLASDASDFITGQNLIIDGGWTTK